MRIEIAGYQTLDIEQIILDFNGTLATDGHIEEAVREQLRELARHFTIHVLTADTLGNAQRELEGLPVRVGIAGGDSVGLYKERVVAQLGPASCACIGNGRNDVAMLRLAALGIVVAGEEGVYPPLLQEAQLMVPSVGAALELFIQPQRIRASLRG